MVMPLWDHSPFKWPKPPYVMWALIIINFAVFFIEAGFWPDEMDQLDQLAGLVPAALTGSATAAGLPRAAHAHSPACSCMAISCTCSAT